MKSNPNFHRLMPLIALTLAGVLLTGCDGNGEPSSDDGPLLLTYQGSELTGNATNGVDPFSVCDLHRPKEALALLRLDSSFETVNLGNCNLDRDYRWSGYHAADVTVVRQAGSTSVPKNIGTRWNLRGYAVDLAASPGTEFVASLRKAGSDWIVTGAIEVTTATSSSGSGDPATVDGRRVDLPTTWSELTTEATSVRAAYDSECEPVDDYDSIHGMSDQEYDEFIHTPERTEPCEVPPDAGSDAG